MSTLPLPLRLARRLRPWLRSRPSIRPAFRPLALERLEERCLLTTLNVGPNIDVAQPSLSGNQSETTIAIDPTDPTDSRLFAASNDDNGGMFARYSTDGGITWKPSNLTGLPNSCCDAQAAFDQFGNLFVTYIGGNTRVLLSTDAGQTFSLIGSFGSGVDQPSIATGPGGGLAPGSVWVDWNQSGTMRATGAPVFGLGQLGRFRPTLTATGGSFGGIAVGANGEVSLTYQTPYTDNGPATIEAITKPDGLGRGGFNPVVDVTGTNVGGFSSIPAQKSRTIDAEANVAYDQTLDRLYLVYTDRTSTSTSDTKIYVRYSDDDGATWSDRILVTDDAASNSKFNDAIAVDQSTGAVAVTWEDARRSPNNATAEVWGAVSTDGGNTWTPNVQIGAGLTDANKANGALNFGDYDTMDFANGSFWRAWADATNPSLLTPPNNFPTSEDPGTARVDVTIDPAVVQARQAVRAAGPVRLLSAPAAAALLAQAQARALPLTEATVTDSSTATTAPAVFDSFFTVPTPRTQVVDGSLVDQQAPAASADGFLTMLQTDGLRWDEAFAAPSLG